MAQLTQDSFDQANRFVKVLFQRGQPIQDYELNEAQDNIRVQNLLAALAIGGDGSSDSGLFVQATGANNAVTLSSGTFMAGGYYLNFPTSITFNGLTTNPGPSQRVDTLYLAISESEVGDPKLNPNLGETTRRRQVQYTLAVAEGVPMPANTSAAPYAGGTRYIALAAITRLANNAVITQDLVTDLRGSLPLAALAFTTARNNASGRTKLVVQAADNEGLNDPQIGVRNSAGAYPFLVDKSGNVTTEGTFDAYRVRNLIPQETDEYDIGTPTAKFRNAFIGGNLFLGDSAVSLHNIQGTLHLNNQGGQTTLTYDGISGAVGIGGGFDANYALAVTGNSSFQGDIDVGVSYSVFAGAGRFDTLANFGDSDHINLTSAIRPDADSAYNLGAPGAGFNQYYGISANVDAFNAYSAGHITTYTDIWAATTSENLGNSSFPFGGMFANNAVIGGIQALYGNPVTVDRSFLPSVADSLNLGASDHAWANLYADTINVNNINLLSSSFFSFPTIEPNSPTASLGVSGTPWSSVYAGNVYVSASLSAQTVAASMSVTAPSLTGNYVTAQDAFSHVFNQQTYTMYKSANGLALLGTTGTGTYTPGTYATFTGSNGQSLSTQQVFNVTSAAAGVGFKFIVPLPVNSTLTGVSVVWGLTGSASPSPSALQISAYLYDLQGQQSGTAFMGRTAPVTTLASGGSAVSTYAYNTLYSSSTQFSSSNVVSNSSSTVAIVQFQMNASGGTTSSAPVNILVFSVNPTVQVTTLPGWSHS